MTGIYKNDTWYIKLCAVYLQKNKVLTFTNIAVSDVNNQC